MSTYRVSIADQAAGRAISDAHEYRQRPAAFKRAEQLAAKNPDKMVSVWEYTGPTSFHVHPVKAPTS